MPENRFGDKDTVEYFLVYSALIQAARHRGTVTYQEAALLTGLPLSGNYMSSSLGWVLGTISENEVLHHRPNVERTLRNCERKARFRFFFRMPVNWACSVAMTLKPKLPFGNTRNRSVMKLGSSDSTRNSCIYLLYTMPIYPLR